MPESTHPWAGRRGGHVTVPTTTAPLPEVNDDCPHCGRPIPEGSAWRIEPGSTLRLHPDCLAARRKGTEWPAPADPLDHLAAARAELASLLQGTPRPDEVAAVLVRALTHVLNHLEQTPASKK